MLDDRPDEFDRRNLFLQAVLGMVSASRRLDAALARESGEEAPVALDDPWLLCVLGAVAFREQAMAVLAGAEAAPDVLPAPPAPPSLGGILR